MLRDWSPLPTLRHLRCSIAEGPAPHHTALHAEVAVRGKQVTQAIQAGREAMVQIARTHSLTTRSLGCTLWRGSTETPHLQPTKWSLRNNLMYTGREG